MTALVSALLVIQVVTLVVIILGLNRVRDGLDELKGTPRIGGNPGSTPENQLAHSIDGDGHQPPRQGVRRRVVGGDPESQLTQELNESVKRGVSNG